MDLTNHPYNRGACGRICNDAQACISGTCTALACSGMTCPAPGLSCCGGGVGMTAGCYNLMTDVRHCGSCMGNCVFGTCLMGHCM